MHLFWDTSAVIPLIMREPHTARAHRAHAAGRRALAWSWMRVEAEAWHKNPATATRLTESVQRLFLRQKSRGTGIPKRQTVQR
jgi:hypothetical protein